MALWQRWFGPSKKAITLQLGATQSDRDNLMTQVAVLKAENRQLQSDHAQLVATLKQIESRFPAAAALVRRALAGKP